MKINISKYIPEYIFGWFLFALRVQDKHAVKKNTQTESKSNLLQINDSSYLHSLEKEKILDKSLTTNHGGGAKYMERNVGSSRSTKTTGRGTARNGGTRFDTWPVESMYERRPCDTFGISEPLEERRLVLARS
jgi:hypothetical protein